MTSATTCESCSNPDHDDQRDHVRELISMTHDCPGGCGRSVAHAYLACSACWHVLPKDLRDAVWSTWRTRTTDPANHRHALADAVRWYRERVST
jgi:hypothetical protein